MNFVSMAKLGSILSIILAFGIAVTASVLFEKVKIEVAKQRPNTVQHTVKNLQLGGLSALGILIPLFLLFFALASFLVSLSMGKLDGNTYSVYGIKGVRSNNTAEVVYNNKAMEVSKTLTEDNFGYYDALSVTYHNKDVSFFDYLHYMFSMGSVGYDYIYNSDIKVEKRTDLLDLEGIITTQIDNGKVSYTIGDTTLTGEDEDKSISSLANNTSVKLHIACVKKDGVITVYKILKATTV